MSFEMEFKLISFILIYTLLFSPGSINGWRKVKRSKRLRKEELLWKVIDVAESDAQERLKPLSKFLKMGGNGTSWNLTTDNPEVEAQCGPIRLLPDRWPEPLLCFQCHSFGNETEPLCDSVLWKFTREKQRRGLRQRCGVLKGAYCFKRVQERFKIRITDRGCAGNETLESPQGNLTIREGCTYESGPDFLTTTCFCQSDLCNASTRIQFVFMFYILTISLIY